MEREQIEKALECCMYRSKNVIGCDECPYGDITLTDDEICSEKLADDATTLISELTKERDGLNILLDCYVAEQEKLNAEIERLRETHSNTCICCGATIPEGRQVCPQCEKK